MYIVVTSKASYVVLVALHIHVSLRLRGWCTSGEHGIYEIYIPP